MDEWLIDVNTESLRLSGIFNLGGLIGIVKVNILFQDRICGFCVMVELTLQKRIHKVKKT